MKHLPKNWELTPFEKCFDNISPGDKKIKRRDYIEQGKFPIIDQGEELIGGYTNNSTFIQNVELPVIIFGDHTRHFKFIDFPFAIGADGTKILMINKSLLNEKFSYYQLLQIELPNKGYSRHYQYLRKITFKVPKFIEEQRQIVEEIETQFTRLDSVVKSLILIKKQLDIYGKSILKAAFEEKYLGTDVKNVKINDVAASVVYGTSKKAKKTGKYPVLRMGNLQHGEIDYANLKFYDSISDINNLCLEEGDILFNRTNSAELVGKTSIYRTNNEFKNVVFASYLIRIRVDREKIIPSYLNYWLNSPQAAYVKAKLKNQQVGQANINGTKLKNIEFPFVSDKDKQEKVVQEIESRLSVIDKIEQTVNVSLKKAEQLRKSILKSAFEGKLVEYEGDNNG